MAAAVAEPVVEDEENENESPADLAAADGTVDGVETVSDVAAAPSVEPELEPMSTEATASDLPASEGIITEQKVQAGGTTEAGSHQQLLPDGWTEVVDPSSQNVYYYHAESGETRWEKPVVIAPSPAPAPAPVVGLEPAAATPTSAAHPEPTPIPEEPTAAVQPPAGEPQPQPEPAPTPGVVPVTPAQQPHPAPFTPAQQPPSLDAAAYASSAPPKQQQQQQQHQQSISDESKPPRQVQSAIRPDIRTRLNLPLPPKRELPLPTPRSASPSLLAASSKKKHKFKLPPPMKDYGLPTPAKGNAAVPASTVKAAAPAPAPSFAPAPTALPAPAPPVTSLPNKTAAAASALSGSATTPFNTPAITTEMVEEKPGGPSFQPTFPPPQPEQPPMNAGADTERVPSAAPTPGLPPKAPSLSSMTPAPATVEAAAEVLSQPFKLEKKLSFSSATGEEEEREERIDEDEDEVEDAVEGKDELHPDDPSAVMAEQKQTSEALPPQEGSTALIAGAIANGLVDEAIERVTDASQGAAPPATGDEAVVEQTSEDALAPGWEEMTDPSSGKPYYYNSQSGETTWDKPGEQVPPPTEAVASQNVETYKSEETIATGSSWEVVAGESQAIAKVTDEVAEPAGTHEEKSGEQDSVDARADGGPESNGPGTDALVAEAEENLEAIEPPVEEDANNPSLLPEGWTEMYDEASSRPYFVYEDGTSQWDRPAPEVLAPVETESPEPAGREPEAAATDEFASAPTSDGWENVNESAPGQQRDVAAGASFGQEDETESLRAMSTKRSYGSSPPPSISELEGMAPPDAEPSEEDTGIEPIAEEAEATLPTSDELPPGWTECFTDDGQLYFYNETDGTSSWDRPTDSTKPVIEDVSRDTQDETESLRALSTKRDAGSSPPPSVSELDEMAYAGDGDLVEPTIEEPNWREDDLPENESNIDETESVRALSAKKDAGASPPPSISELDDMVPPDAALMEEENESEAAIPEQQSGGQLPEGWVELIDESSGQPYYLNEHTQEVTWDRPEDEAPQISSEPEVADEAENPSVDEKPAEGGSIVGPSEEEVIEPESDVAKHYSLPLGWTEEIHDETGERYYVHEDGRTQWERPAMEPPTETNEAASEEIVPSNADHAVEASSADGPPEPEPSSTNDLPPGWSENVHDETGEIYYAHEDGRSQWEKPVGAEVEGDIPSAEPEVTAEEDQYNQTQEGDAIVDDASITELTKAGSHLRHADVAEPESAALVDAPMTAEKDDIPPPMDPVDTGDLPPGWEAIFDEDSQSFYYYNEELNETSWDKPTAPGTEAIRSLDDEAVQEEEQKQGPTAEDSEYVHVDRPEAAVAPTGETQQLHNNAIHSQDETSAALDLPVGWVELYTDAGEAYYYNEATQETTWDRPSDPVDYRSAAIVAAPSGDAEFRPRPGHALASFGFGGKLSVMIPQPATSLMGSSTGPVGLRKGPVVVHTLSHFLDPSDAALPSRSQLKPLVDMSEAEAFQRIQEELTNDDSLLWNLIFIAAKFRGCLRSINGPSDPNSPESAIVEVLLAGNDKAGKAQPAYAIPSPLKIVERRNDAAEDETEAWEEIQDYLIRGEREKAVARAVSSKKYALALLVTVMCGRDTYQEVARQFIDDSLQNGSPLHTTAMLFSGQLLPPQDDALDRSGATQSFWSDESLNLAETWKYQLAAIINNRTAGWERIILSLGDRLLQIDEVCAAHFCYMVCGCSMTDPSHRLARFCLLGSDHIVPINTALMTRESIESYERTEAFEWAKRRGNPNAAIPPLQHFKLAYAKLLADFGLVESAKMYVDSIRRCTGLGVDEEDDSKRGIHYPKALEKDLNIFEDRLCVVLGVPSPSMQKSRQASERNAVSRTLESVSSVISKGLRGATKSNDGKPRQDSATDSSQAADASFVSAMSMPAATSAAVKPEAKVPPSMGMARIEENSAQQTFSPQQPMFSPKTNRQPQEDDNMSFISATSNMLDVTGATFKSAHPGEAALPSASESSAGGDPFAAGRAGAGGPSSSFEVPTKPPAVAGVAGAPKTAPPGPLPDASEDTIQPPASNKSDSAILDQKEKKKKQEEPPTSASGGWSLRNFITKKFNPDATVAVLEDAGKMVYSEEHKIYYVLGEEDPAEKAKAARAPPAPPPTTPMPSAPAPTSVPPPSDDPLAALMAPPNSALSRMPAGRGPGGTPAAGGGPPFMSGPPGMPPIGPTAVTPMAKGAAPPQFKIFTPTAASTNQQSDDADGAKKDDDGQQGITDPFALGGKPPGPPGPSG